MSEYYVYILTNKSLTLYIGVTNNLERRLAEHKQHLVPGFTTRYQIDKLVYFETTENIEAAMAREKQLKGWTRQKKMDLITGSNPNWRSLSDEWM